MAAALDRLTDLEAASRDVLIAAAESLEKTRQDNADAMERAAAARFLLWYDGPRQEGLTARLNAVVRQQLPVGLTWPLIPPGVVTVAELEAARQGLTVQTRAIRANTVSLLRVAADVFATGPDRWRHWMALSRDQRHEVRRLFPRPDQRPEDLTEALQLLRDTRARALEVVTALTPERQPALSTSEVAVAARAVMNLADATEGLKAVLRATAWWRAEALLGPGHGFTRQDAARVMDAADRLVPTGRPARTDAERFSWLASEIGLQNQDFLPSQLGRRVTRRPARARLFAHLLLAAEVQQADASEPIPLPELANLRRLADLVRARTARRNLTLDDLRDEFRAVYGRAANEAVTLPELRQLVRQVGQVKAIRGLVTHADLLALAQSRSPGDGGRGAT